MPMLILALAVIPGGIEGASYAMITTCINVAYEVGQEAYFFIDCATLYLLLNVCFDFFSFIGDMILPVCQVGYSIGTSFTGIWNVSDCNFEGRKFEGMAKLTILTSLLQLSPVVLIWMFPTGKQAVFDSLKNEVNYVFFSFFCLWFVLFSLGVCHFSITIY